MAHSSKTEQRSLLFNSGSKMADDDNEETSITQFMNTKELNLKPAVKKILKYMILVG